MQVGVAEKPRKQKPIKFCPKYGAFILEDGELATKL
jgi:hypothetical protein